MELKKKMKRKTRRRLDDVYHIGFMRRQGE